MTIKTAVSAVIAIAGLTLQATAQLVTPAPHQVAATAPQTDPLARAAALYATYQGEVTDVKSNGFSSASDIEDSLNNLGGHNPEQLTQGWMAYSALVAAQNPEFRAAVLDIEGYYGRDMLMTGMQNDVRYARTLSGGNSAVNQALTAVKADSSRLIGAAAFVKEQAYSLQGSGWAKGRLGNSKAKATNLFASTQTGIPARGSLVQAIPRRQGSPRAGARASWPHRCSIRLGKRFQRREHNSCAVCRFFFRPNQSHRARKRANRGSDHNARRVSYPQRGPQRRELYAPSAE